MDSGVRRRLLLGQLAHLRELLERRLVSGIHAGGRYLFGSPRSPRKPITRTQLYRVIRSAAERAALRGRIGTHTMRKTFADRVYDYFLAQVAAGRPVDAFRSTSKALGHSDIKSTDSYLSFRTQDIDDAVEAIGK